jgi:hypothetical protein
MKKAIKQICFLFLAFGLVTILADGSSINHTFYPAHDSLSKDCADVSNHFENSCSICCEDDIFLIHSKVKSGIILNFSDPFPGLIVLIQNSHSSSIWQPPKFS